MPDRSGRPLSHRLDWIALLPPAALFLAVIWDVYRQFDVTLGLDYRGNVDYVRYVDLTASFPLADQGWQMYHPPAYYALTALLFEALHWLGLGLTLPDAGRAVATLAWGLEGVVAAAAVRALGCRWVGMAVASSAVWLLPGQAMVGSMVYNETLTGLGVGLMVLGVVLCERERWTGLLWIGLGLPLAALSKYSGLVAVLAALPILIWVGRTRPWGMLLALLPGSLTIGIHYFRNLAAFGTPTPLNGDLFHLRAWEPLGWGHSPSYFMRVDLGPCVAGSSFWGGFWKWFWVVDCGDVNFNHQALPWPEVMAPWLLVVALLTTAFAVTSLLWMGFRALRRLVLGPLVAIPLLVFASFVYYNLHLPSWTSGKGLYLLVAVVPVAAAGALLADRLAVGRFRQVATYAVLIAWSLSMARAASGP